MLTFAEEILLLLLDDESGEDIELSLEVTAYSSL